MKEFPLKYKKALIFTSHPDDLEGFIGGTVKKLTNGGTKVFSIIFSEGNQGKWFASEEISAKRNSEIRDIRVSEAENAKKILGISNVKTYGFDDRHIPQSSESLAKIVKDIEEIDPDLVLSFEFEKHQNYDPHPDHIAVGKLVKNVALSLPAKDKQFDYYVFSTLSPTHTLRIDEVIDIKREAIGMHKTQANLNKVLFPFIVWLPDKIRGLLLGNSKSAEGFRHVNKQ